ncbi:cytochrome c biogenesis protein CcdA [Sporichthya sp.]|uniref:cytochrome c biogenesis CcdA family protein n=1 Tax=Sporichthya sp. TaxID=65475 RepID=UPI0017DD206B|nr:cytochrome c biogenesis protein CcdA [Sporichthya sp.]MBA3743342.1 cytochrome c biogenesis protein CcdA [Sporichthya sp.]
MFDAPVGFAFSAGTVAAFNPCGFALLPAYLGLFLAGDQDEVTEARPGRPGAAIGRAALVATAVAAGFVAVFGIAGLLISQTAVTVQEYTPWISLVIGAALVPAGVAMLRGWTPKIRLPAVKRAGKGTGPMAMFWFGVSYATVSLSCTIPAFLVAVVGTFSDEGGAAGLLVFTAYTAGMASVLVVMTVIVATAQQGMLATVRRVLPYVNKVAGVLAILAGAYVAYYGYYEIRLERGGDPDDPIVDFVGGDLAGRVNSWVADLGTGPILVAAGVVVVLVAGLTIRSRRRAGRQPSRPISTSTIES